MGTRHLICVFYNGRFVVAQYGQMDGYLEGQGKTIMKFLCTPTNITRLKNGLEHIYTASEEEISASKCPSLSLEHIYTTYEEEISASKFPSLNRTTGAGILELISLATDERRVPIDVNISFANDWISCEWAYVLDLDTEILEIFQGHEMGSPGHRFGKIGGSQDAVPWFLYSINFSELRGMLSTAEDKPWVPNFSVEVKGPNGRPAVATQQVRYYGAVGSRAMHSLQNYGEEEPKYDGEAYTYSSVYHGGNGTLQLYAHHITAPTGEEDRPEYHMTKIRGFEMTDTRETFLQGATAFRNARDLAKRHRDRFIQAANARASQSRTSVSQDVVETLEEGSPATNHSEWQDGDEELQQSTADTGGYNFRDDSEGTAIPQYLSIEGDSEEPSQDSAALRDDPSLDFASSFTSSFSSAKRPRQSVSPPPHSRGSRSSKSQMRLRKRRTAESTTALAAQSGSSEVWEDT